MKRRAVIVLACVFAAGVGVVVLGLNSYYRLETSRGVYVDRAEHVVRITRSGRVMAIVTPEGPFPVWSESVVILPTSATKLDGATGIVIPGNATSNFHQIAKGTVHLEPAQGKASVRLVPDPKYYWLKLDGEYPICYSP